MKKALNILLELFAYFMIAFSLCVYLIQRILNSFVFWQDYPSYKAWLRNTKMNISGIIQLITIGAYFLSPWTLFVNVPIYLLFKIWAIYGRQTTR